jgi:rhamnose utilization protein RhaD (predicted bifunctional aldolase and dehydrogenase)
MASNSATERRQALIELSHELGQEDRRMAILGEGNVSTRMGEGEFLVKASGMNLGSLGPAGVVACRAEGLLALLDAPESGDERVEEALLAARLDPSALKPSVEALFHAYLLSLSGVEWVGHTHPIAVNRVLCSPRAAEFAQQRMFPDEIVCCGDKSVFVAYTDPGLRLAAAIRAKTEAFVRERGQPPRVILLASHGVITLGARSSAVLGAMLMVQKAAEIWIGAAALGGPVFLSESEVRRIADRADEHYRQRALNL